MKTAIITGAASGLGLEFSKLLAADGYDLIMVDKDSEKLSSSQITLQGEFPVKIIGLPMDLAQIDSADCLYEQTKDLKPEVVINNAGFGVAGFFAETAWELERELINLQVYTPTRFCKLIIKDMQESGKGRIMNVSSIAAFSPGPIMAVYYSIKAYLLSFGRALSNELKGTGVTITTVCPGLTKTSFPRKRALLSGVAPPEFGLMADSPERVAKIAYRAMNKGKPVSIPVFKNKFLSFVMWLLPKSWVIQFIRRSQAEINEIN